MLRRVVLMHTRRDIGRYGRCLENPYGIYTSAGAIFTRCCQTARSSVAARQPPRLDDRRASSRLAATRAYGPRDLTYEMPWIEGMTQWRRDELRTNLWLVPTVEVLAATALFVATGAIDRAAYQGSIRLPAWVISGTADAARQILASIGGAVITVVGIVFSITIVTLTLASTQFGPRLLRNFIRDRGTQLTLGTFVATLFTASWCWSRSVPATTATTCRTCRSP